MPGRDGHRPRVVINAILTSWMESVLDALLLDLEICTISQTSRQDPLLAKTGRHPQPGHARPAEPEPMEWRHFCAARGSFPACLRNERAALEALFGQARVVVSEAEQRARSYWQWQAERQAEDLRETNRALLTTFNIHQLGDVLFEHLPGLGIPSAYLVLYETPCGSMGFSRLMMAYTEQGRAAIDPAGWRFPTRQLIPPEFLPHERRYSLVVEPLYFQEKSLGYAVFEVGPRDGDIYELVRANLSSAIQGALLFDEIQQARLTAEKADRIKTRLLANVSHELRTPLNIILGHTQNLLAPSRKI